MSGIDEKLLEEVARSMIDARLDDFKSLAESHGVPFAASVMLTVCAEIAGTALATSKDEKHRLLGGIAFTLAMKKAMDFNGAGMEMTELLERIKEPAR